MYKVICQKSVHSLSVQMAVMNRFLQLFILLEMYNNFEANYTYIALNGFFLFIVLRSGFIKRIKLNESSVIYIAELSLAGVRGVPPEFGSCDNPIPTRGGRSCPPHYW